MKTERNILIAFLLNLSFSIFELFGGIFTNSVAILSDSIHDLGDALSIGISFFLEKKSKKKADKKYTYGYVRYSVLGGEVVMLFTFHFSLLTSYAQEDDKQTMFNPVEHAVVSQTIAPDLIGNYAEECSSWSCQALLSAAIIRM